MKSALPKPTLATLPSSLKGEIRRAQYAYHIKADINYTIPETIVKQAEVRGITHRWTATRRPVRGLSYIIVYERISIKHGVQTAEPFFTNPWSRNEVTEE